MNAKWALYANLSLLVLFPLVWAAPLLRAGLLPLFGLAEISVVSGIGALWEEAPVLAVLVALFALVAPYAKTLTLAAVQLGWLQEKPVWLTWLGRLAMADVFLIALYIVAIKGVGLGRVEVAWGLYAFTALIILSLVLTYLTPDPARGKQGALP
ncbi:MAG: paraquat-inducible protein A [Dinoroseobacter sp.]|nr:paraquat-inducible protein A [Dinoroseobacter sp.]MDJ0995433.1 paraquat-inducible protein A [Dinoroseobacter sp.]